MNEKVKFPPLTREEFEQAYLEACEQVDDCYRDDPNAVFAEILAEKRRLNWAKEVIEKSHQERNGK